MKANKSNLFLAIILAIALVFGMALIGCDDGSGDDGAGGSGGTGGGGGGGGTYIITGSGNSLTVTKNGATICSGGGDMYTYFEIQNDANGADCTLQFGDGTNVLDIGTGVFHFSTVGKGWGVITLTGKITSSGTGTITNYSPSFTINSTADIENTHSNGTAISNIGVFNINGGTVKTNSTSGYAIYNYGGGTVTISPTATIIGTKFGMD